ncbi:thiamine-phosphate kinase [Corynebacterium phocae]|uniref:thiamine-phosphate kinase n=1 Tax=Corynebacterium phocae TaxID=161895 RepID=UPI000AE229B4|nr:thiamine-phosphate kinase [Corynebacterium phocae]
MHETLASVGEQEVIRAITAIAGSSLNGDDAAVLHPGAPNHLTVVATDMMVEGNHFRQEWSTPEEVGEKIILRNFADVESMGARPVASLLAIAAPPDTPLEFVRGLARGIAKRQDKYNAELVGGDVTHSSQIVITLTALGALGGDLPALTLSAARPGQTVIAHGRIGWAGAGLALLQRYGRAVPSEFAPLVKAQCAPWIDPGRGVVARAAGAKAMTDNSDGLIQDLTTVATKSGVGIDLDSAALEPDDLLVAAARALDADPWEWVLAGGEDHTLIGTTPGDVPTGFVPIGRTTAARDTGVVVDGRKPQFSAGWSAL